MGLTALDAELAPTALAGVPVVHVAQPTTAGVADHVRRLAVHQHGLGARVSVLSPVAGDLAAALAGTGVRHVPWRAGRSPGPGTVRETLELGRLLRSVEPEGVVHLHSAKAGLAGRLALRGRRPTLYQPHGWSWLAATGPMAAAARVWEAHASRWTSVTVCVSADEDREGRAAGVAGTAVVIANGTDTSAREELGGAPAARARLGLPCAPTVVCVGRVCRQKGQDLLLQAWPAVQRAVPAAQLVLVGGERPAHVPALPGVLFAGWQDDVADWLRAADVVAAPSRWEGMSLTVLDALAAGRPVVATDVQGMREAVGADAGAVVPVEDVHALAAALAARLSAPALAVAEGQRARLRARTRFDLSAVLDRTCVLTAQVGRTAGAA